MPQTTPAASAPSFHVVTYLQRDAELAHRWSTWEHSLDGWVAYYQLAQRGEAGTPEFPQDLLVRGQDRVLGR